MFVVRAGDPPAEEVCGESEHNVTHLQMIAMEQSDNYGSGVFISGPIPFSGTIFSINASGFCTVGNRNGQPFVLRMFLFSRELHSVQGQNITAITCEEVPVKGTNLTIGSILDIKTNIAVTEGYSLAIMFSSLCSDTPDRRCSFRPSTTTTTSPQFFYTNETDTDMLRNLQSTDGLEMVGLQFSFHIRNGETTHSSPLLDTNYIVHIIYYYVPYN